jgi:hypothetical protein
MHYFTHKFLVTNDLSAAEFGSCGFLPDLKNRMSQGPGLHLT